MREAGRSFADRWDGSALDAVHEPPEPAESSWRPDVPAGTPDRPPVTDGEALLALAQDALVAEKAAHPDIARRRRPHLTARIDPLSGWGRQVDGELLPPASLRAVLKAPPAAPAWCSCAR